MKSEEILKHLIDNNQDNIKHIEAKSVFISAILGGVCIYYINALNNLLDGYNNFSIENKILLIAVLIMVVLNSLVLITNIYPISNPVNQLDSSFKVLPNLYLNHDKIVNQKINFEAVNKMIDNENSLKDGLTLDYVTTSHIRNKKMIRLRNLIRLNIVLVVLFIAHIVVYNLDLKEISERNTKCEIAK